MEYPGKDDFVLQHGDWIINDNNEFVFTNQQVMDAQKDVIKYIIKQVGSNLLSGKSIMNMSLPVDIFDSRSILERAAASFGYAPIFLSKAFQSTDDIEQMSMVATFMSTAALLELKV
jgi:hypothetical protein